MPKCARCLSRPPIYFGYVNGVVVHACRRHWRGITIDFAVGWMRLPRMRRIAE